MGAVELWELMDFFVMVVVPTARLIMDTIEFITEVWLKWKRKSRLSNPNQHNQDAEEGHIPL